MRSITLLATMLLGSTGCEVYLYEEGTTHEHHEVCHEPEPYSWSAEVYHEHYNHEGFYVGECGEWFVGQGWHEEWCNWFDVCGWEYVGEYRTW